MALFCRHEGSDCVVERGVIWMGCQVGVCPGRYGVSQLVQSMGWQQGGGIYLDASQLSLQAGQAVQVVGYYRQALRSVHLTCTGASSISLNTVCMAHCLFNDNAKANPALPWAWPCLTWAILIRQKRSV